MMHFFIILPHEAKKTNLPIPVKTHLDKRTFKASGHCTCFTRSRCPLPIIHITQCVG